VIEATGIVVLSVPVRRARNRSADPALPTNPAVVAGRLMPNGKTALDSAYEKK
jgi:hypothetical protein